MAVEFKLPDLGEGITTGDIKKWHVRKGDKVEEDDTLVEVETDKAVVELPSPATGTVTDLRFDEGASVNVGDVIAVIGEEGEAVKEKPVQEKAEEKAAKEAVKPEPSPPEREKKEIPALATPSTRMLAKQLNVNINDVRGTGPGGRITDEDVKKAAGKPAEAPQKPSAPPEAAKAPEKPAPAPVAGAEERIPIKGIRKTISENMARTARSTVQVTVFDDADVTELSEWRDRVNSLSQDGVKISYLAYVVKAVATALREHPYLNSSVDEEKNEIILKKYYNIGIAVDTDRGLLVPVIKDADRKSLTEISREIKNTVDEARSGQIGVSQLKGGTFTVTNIGSIGGLWSTPILNYPELAILEMQQIREMPRVAEGEIMIRKVMNLCLTIDHKIIDGAVGQRFLNSVKRYIENPQLFFTRMV